MVGASCCLSCKALVLKRERGEEDVFDRPHLLLDLLEQAEALVRRCNRRIDEETPAVERDRRHAHWYMHVQNALYLFEGPDAVGDEFAAEGGAWSGWEVERALEEWAVPTAGSGGASVGSSSVGGKTGLRRARVVGE